MINALLDLALPTLEDLAKAVRRGELDRPSAYHLQPYCPADQVEPLLGELTAAQAEGLSRVGLAMLIETLAEDRKRRAALHPDADLVWSGPDLEGEFVRDTRVVVHELFRKARMQVFVSTYALYQGQDLFAPLHETWLAHSELKVTLFLDITRGDKDLPTKALLAHAREKFQKEHWPWEPRPEVYYDPRSLEPLGSPKRACLHAKTVVVDGRDVFVTSANLTEAAQQRNIEVGLLMKSPRVAKQVTEHFQALLKQGLLVKL